MVRSVFLFAGALLALPGWCPWSECHLKTSAVVLWSSIIRQCANSDILGDSYLFLGPATVFGPGDIVVKTPNGGYGLKYELSDIVTNTRSYLALTAPASCSGATTVKWDINVGVPFANQLGGLSAPVAADLSSAQSSSVTITGYQWVSLVEAPFDKLIDELSTQDSPYAGAIAGTYTYVIYRALQVDGASATFNFSQSSANSLRAKYNTPLLHATSGGVDLSVKWTSSTQLQLTATSPFYIAAVPAEYSDPVATVGSSLGTSTSHLNAQTLNQEQIGEQINVQAQTLGKLTPIKVDPKSTEVSWIQ
jgi:hypothetical protein